MKKIITLIYLVCLSNTTFASYPEFFGSSFSSATIANQSTLDANDPSNNYYTPAVLGFSDKVNILVQASGTQTSLKRMTNITITNSTNSTTAATTGNVENKYANFYGNGIHFALPIGYQHLGTLGASIYLPTAKLLETNSGNAFLPEYVMYRSRYRRTSIYINFARKWNEDLAWSLGSIMGFQASSEVKTDLSLNGSSYGSWGQARGSVAPSLGIIASVVKKFTQSKVYFAYQQEMKSNFRAAVIGEITNPSTGLFNSTMDSMIFYDPHTFRLGSSFEFGATEIFTSVEYQLWTGYKPPTIFIAKSGGVIVSSSNYEKITMRDTINPRIGINYNLTNRWTLGSGVGYRMTPLSGDFSGSGNSIDTNAYIYSTGIQYRMVIWSKDVSLGTSFQYHQLQKKRVTKSTGQENGNAGDKIGAGGYDIAGNIMSATFGIKFNF